jgi:NAD(P)-dependent dehydrogenase (short-subunit alcohol dehydrogenase family)
MTTRTQDDMGIAGKVAIVTGGGAAGEGIGNGRAASILLARAGAKVIVVDREIGLAERTVAMIADEGGIASARCADVTSEQDCRGIVDFAVKQYGRLDLLDNNVGIASRGPVTTAEPADWQRVMQVNVETMVLMSKHAIPAMIGTARGGAIVNISSLSALRPLGATAYAASKGAVIALTRAMAVDHGREGIRVNCVAPGPVYTPMVNAGGMDDATRGRRRNASALGIEGTGWDIGLAVRFLLSEQARYITGQTLVVDGGTAAIGPSRSAEKN